MNKIFFDSENKSSDKRDLTEEENRTRFLVGATFAGGDGDLLHLSEGISNDLMFSLLETSD